MVSIYDVQPRKLIEAMAAELEKMPEMAPPEWANYVKTGVHNERPPAEKNWWYIRSAAILRSIYKLGPIGVSKLRTKYGGRKNRGHAPDKTFRASGNIIRKILQKLELVGLVKQAEVGHHKGRELTPSGKSFVDKIVVKHKTPYSKAPKEEKPKKAEKPKKTEQEEQPVKEEKPKKTEKPTDAEPKEQPVKEEKPKKVKTEQSEKPAAEKKPKDAEEAQTEEPIVEESLEAQPAVEIAEPVSKEEKPKKAAKAEKPQKAAKAEKKPKKVEA